MLNEIKPGHEHQTNRLKARRFGIDTQYEAFVFMHKDCPVCRSEGFAAHTRVVLHAGNKQVIATLYHAAAELIHLDEVAISESAWLRLGLKDGDFIDVTHLEPLKSMSHVRSRIYGNELAEDQFSEVIHDIVAGRYSDIHLSSFVTACSTRPLVASEILYLTRAMVEVGERLSWNSKLVADKHCVGGLPGNRTTPIVVSILAALNLTIPKTSSRAITSPAGTADTMETLAPVELNIEAIHQVVEREGGCIVWGGAVKLSPADDILIRIERALDLDAEGQLIASVISKKVAAGSTHLVLDLPVGPTAKVRSAEAANTLSSALIAAANAFGIQTKTIISDGSQPVGRGIGPALEAKDVLSVLRCEANAPKDLRDRATALAGALLELTGFAQNGRGTSMAEAAIDDGRAWSKFQRICEAQGGMRVPTESKHRKLILAEGTGYIRSIDNRRIATLAKLAGAPNAKSAGVELHVRLGDQVAPGQPLVTVHAEAPGELAYAWDYAVANKNIISVAD
jgi:thymidine phosphorylase